jgi:hypothetical protein
MNLHPNTSTAAAPHNIINLNQTLLEDMYRFVDEGSEARHDSLNNLNDDVEEASEHTVSSHFFASSLGSAFEFEYDIEESKSSSSWYAKLKSRPHSELDTTQYSNQPSASFSDLPIYNPNQSSLVFVKTKSADKTRLHETQIQLAPPNLFKSTPIVKDWQLQPPWKPSFPDRGLDLRRKNCTTLLALEGDADLAAHSPAFTYQITLYIQMYLCEQSTLQVRYHVIGYQIYHEISIELARGTKSKR